MFTVIVSDNMARPDQRLRWSIQSQNHLHSEDGTNKSLSNTYTKEGTFEVRTSPREGEPTRYSFSSSSAIVGLHFLHIYAEGSALASPLVVTESPVFVEVTPYTVSIIIHSVTSSYMVSHHHT
jgi:hypothetical protein